MLILRLTPANSGWAFSMPSMMRASMLPLAGLEYITLSAALSTAASLSTVEMSGVGSPLCTASPIRTRPIVIRLLLTIFLSVWAWSIRATGRKTISAAGGVPAFNSSIILAMLKVWIWTLMPISFSKPIARSRMPALAVTAGVMIFNVTSLCAIAGVANAINTTLKRNLRIFFPLLLFRSRRGAPHLDVAVLGPEIHHGADQQ